MRTSRRGMATGGAGRQKCLLHGVRRGQTMVETVIAVLIIASLFVVLFKLSYMFLGKICLEHAAMRAARARTIGMNDFMCRKAARVAVIPAAGKRLWPEHVDDWDESQNSNVASLELGRIANYLITKNEPTARGVLEYEGWRTLGASAEDSGRRVKADVSMDMMAFREPEWRVRLHGHAEIERHSDLYLTKEP